MLLYIQQRPHLEILSIAEANICIFWQLIASFVAVADFAAAALAVSDGVAVAVAVAVGSPGASCLRDLVKISFGPVSSFCIFYH